MNYKQLRRAIEIEWNAIEQWEIDECILGSQREPDKGKGGRKGKNCHIQNRVTQVIDRNGYATEF